MLRRTPPRMPKRRRPGPDPLTRTLRIGHVVWRARLSTVDELPEQPLIGREFVCLEREDGARHHVVMRAGEFERLSNYRLRSVILGLDDQGPDRSVA